MPPALQVISGRVTNPSTTFTALTPNTGDSYTVKNFLSGKAYILNAWTKEASLGDLRVRSPLLHENTQGIRMRTPLAAKCRPLLPFDHKNVLQAQDALTVEMTGGASETDAGCLLVYYDDLLGGYDSLISVAQYESTRLQTVDLEIAVTSGGTAGQYSGTVAINNTLNILKANTAYAIIGYTTDTELVNVGISGPDLSNLRLGGPGSTDSYLTANWFYALSAAQNLPLIPVINSANAPNTNVDVVDTGTASSINVTLIMSQLSTPPPASNPG